MATMATTVAAIRNILQDEPDETYTTASLSDSATTVTVNDINKFAVGQTWEFDDGATGAERVLIRAKADSTSTITMKRAHRGSTASSHSSGVVMLKAPRYAYDEVAQAVNTVLDADLYKEGLFDLTEHQVTSSATTDHYNAPSTSCLRFLDVYQQPAAYDEPQRKGLRYTPDPRNVDTALFANGKYFVIQGNYGIPGTDIYYVTCAHKCSISTLSTPMERVVQLLAVAYLLEWSEPRRLGGPNNQGDETVRPGASVGTAAYFRGLAEELIQKEQHALKDLIPQGRRFVRYG